jgi:hypothetical protein
VATAAPPLSEWHNYSTTVGTASATLIGAMFVVVSIGINMVTPDRAAAIRAYQNILDIQRQPHYRESSAFSR